ncbi:MAG: amidohydrolase family protein [Armatimonadota bacterium]|nr:amidohydrolase family protein [Armatimonadota bacterium]
MLIIDCDTFFGTRANCRTNVSPSALVETLGSDGIRCALAYSVKARTFDAQEGNNDALSAARTHPEILPVASVDPRSFERLEEEIARSAELGFAALRVFPELQGWSVDSVLFSRIVNACAEHNLPLMVSTETPGKASAVVERAANASLPIIMLGANYNVLAEVLSAAQARPNTYVSTQYFVTPGALELAVESVGADRLVLGTGSPDFSARPAVNVILGADIPDSEKNKILGGNAATIIAGQLAKLGARSLESSLETFRRRSLTEPIIDVHGHLGPWPFPMRGWGGADVVQLMRRRGIEKAILSSTKAIVNDFVDGNADLAREIADFDELLGYVTVNPNHLEESIQEINRYLGSPKFVGVKTHPGYSGQSIDSPAMRELLAVIAAAGAPLLVHCWGHGEPSKVGKLAEEYPHVPIIMGHGGVTAWQEAIEVMKTAPNVYTEFCSSRVERGRVRATIDAVGCERVLFGSDLGLFDPIYNLGIYEEADLTPAEREAVMYGNAKRLFGIS